MSDASQGGEWRHVKVTAQRAARDFAECLRDSVDLHDPRARWIRVVLDELSTHTPAARYAAFAPDDARWTYPPLHSPTAAAA